MRSLKVFRWIVTVHCALILVQAGLAGRYLSGGFDAITIHSAAAGSVMLVAVVQVVAAGWLWRAGRGPGWPLGASALVWFADAMQVGAGFSHNLGLHVPLGVALFGATAALAGWAWSGRPGVVARETGRV